MWLDSFFYNKLNLTLAKLANGEEVNFAEFASFNSDKYSAIVASLEAVAKKQKKTKKVFRAYSTKTG